MSDGRFTLALGAGERLNEHVVGRGWPSVDVRHEMLTESVEAMRLLWRGGFQTYRGKYITVEDARLYTLPSDPPDVLIAGSGEESLELAARLGDGLVAIEPDAGLLKQFDQAGGSGKRRLGQVALSYDTDMERAVEYAMRFKFGVSGWKVMAELPNPVNFEAATSSVRPDDVTQMVACGPDPDAHVEAIRSFAEAGYEEIAVVQVGDDHEGFFAFWREELAPRL